MKSLRNKKEKGAFSPLLLLSFLALVGAGFFVYKGGALDPFLANISQIMLGDQTTMDTPEESRVDSIAPSGNEGQGEEPETEEEKPETFKVLRVIDGDTIVIEGEKEVRYLGIDAPDTVDPEKPVECYGTEASHKNRELVSGKEVRLEKDLSDRDPEGRLLRYVWVGDVMVNELLVKEGYARTFIHHPDVKYSYQLAEAEEEARRKGIGLWNVCRISPWEVSFSETDSQKLNGPGLREGCTDLAAVNFDPRADINDDSCRYYQRKGLPADQDTVPPQISNVRVESIGTSSAVIIWETSEPATSRIQFGTGTPPLQLTPFDSELTTLHEVILRGLKTGTTYYYRIISLDAYNNHPYFFLRGFSTLHLNGSLSVEVVKGIPEKPLVMVGESDKLLGQWDFKANKVSDLQVTQVIIYNNHPAGSGNVADLDLWCGGKKMVAQTNNLVSDRITFRSAGQNDCVVPREGSLVFSLYGDIVDSAEGGSGEKIQFSLSLPETITSSPDSPIVVRSNFGNPLPENPGEKLAPCIYPLRTSLEAGMECHEICLIREERKREDKLANLILSSADGGEALIESLTVDVQGDIPPMATSTVFYVEDLSGSRKSQGVLDYQNQEVTFTFDPLLIVDSSPRVLTIITDTAELLGMNGKHLALSIKTGDPEASGGFKWYDNASSTCPITWLEQEGNLFVELGYY
ncbi:MAG: hypothetical protein GF370_02595 [Candidatus Nealsonbacteria bacterium]|nr:hypothetical protein [Candidatus Nealsonbacteria bacterium]